MLPSVDLRSVIAAHTVGYVLLNSLDRNAIVNGKLNGLDAELGMVGSQYNTCVSIFFVG